ncbi:hypothetical protein OAM67_01305, partial [bacterium]|nr:hypothetical protein [bacterium]
MDHYHQTFEDIYGDDVSNIELLAMLIQEFEEAAAEVQHLRDHAVDFSEGFGADNFIPAKILLREVMYRCLTLPLAMWNRCMGLWKRGVDNINAVVKRLYESEFDKGNVVAASIDTYKKRHGYEIVKSVTTLLHRVRRKVLAAATTKPTKRKNPATNTGGGGGGGGGMRGGSKRKSRRKSRRKPRRKSQRKPQPKPQR